MTKTAKVLLGIGGTLAILIILAIAGLYVGANYLEKRFGESANQEADAGREFAKTVDQQGCMTESLRKSKSFALTDFTKGINLAAFAGGCLDNAKPTAGFCDGVPPYWSTDDSKWGANECQKAGLDPEKTACMHVFQVKHRFCNP